MAMVMGIMIMLAITITTKTTVVMAMVMVVVLKVVMMKHTMEELQMIYLHHHYRHLPKQGIQHEKEKEDLRKRSIIIKRRIVMTMTMYVSPTKMTMTATTVIMDNRQHQHRLRPVVQGILDAVHQALLSNFSLNGRVAKSKRAKLSLLVVLILPRSNYTILFFYI